MSNLLSRLLASCLLLTTIASSAADIDVRGTRFGAWGLDIAGLDTSVRPGNDFYMYANGSALKRMKIPSDATRAGIVYSLIDLSQARVRSIIEQSAAGGDETDSEAAKIGRFYKAYMNEKEIQKIGDSSLQADLNMIRHAQDRIEISRLMGLAPSSFYVSLFDTEINPDPKRPARYGLRLTTTTDSGLPDKDYYVGNDRRFVEARRKYQAYIAQLLALAKWKTPRTSAREVMDFEKSLALASVDRSELRDPEKTYCTKTPSELAAYAPGVSWMPFFGALGIEGIDQVILSDSTSLQAKARIFADTPLDTLKAWQAFHVVDNAAPYLPNAFVSANFEFRSKFLLGQPVRHARWKNAVKATDDALGEAIGKIYVSRYFSASAKSEVAGIVANIKRAFGQRIENNEWMSAETKTQALQKLASLTIKVGYPETWRDYSGLEVSASELYTNIKTSRKYDWQFRTQRYFQPVDRAQWGLTPQTVNAYYEAALNEIVFPAALLQPPIFDPAADVAINYGGIGATIGHELIHGFDDGGRQSDGNGILRNWWTADDATAFTQRADRLVVQYSANSPLPGEHIRGDLTLSENIADLGGITLALDAYRASLNGRPQIIVDGFSGEQRVFLGWAQGFRDKVRDSALIQQLHTNPHPPSPARVNEVFRNVDSWYAAFNVSAADALYLPPEQRVRIW